MSYCIKTKFRATSERGAEFLKYLSQRGLFLPDEFSVSLSNHVLEQYKTIIQVIGRDPELSGELKEHFINAVTGVASSFRQALAKACQERADAQVELEIEIK